MDWAAEFVPKTVIITLVLKFYFLRYLIFWFVFVF